jgi:hypothetical protein
VLAREAAVHGVAAAPEIGAVHDVVVHESEGVHQLERGGRIDYARVVDSSARPDESAHAKRRPQTLAAGGNELAQRAEGIDERGIHGVPPLDLGCEQRVDASLDPVGNRIERFGKRGGPSRRAGHGERLRRGLRRLPIVGP